MGQETTEKNVVIDFLYKDIDLINSFYSQLFGGNLTKISKTEVAADEVSNEMKASITVLSGKSNSKKSTNRNMQKEFDPLDTKIIDFLESLNLPETNLSSSKNNSIVSVKGSTLLRSFEILNKLIPMICEGNLVPEFNVPFNENAKGKNRNFTNGKFLSKLLDVMPYGLELELKTNNGECASCVLKDKFLTISSTDLLRVYGSNLPGEWTVVGIIDESIKSDQQNNNIVSNNDFKNLIDSANQAITILLGEGTKKIIRPIVIYREVYY